VATCTETAKLLHYNGAMKPWLMDKTITQEPVCEVPASLQAKLWHSFKAATTSSREHGFVACSEIWSRFISESWLVVPDKHLQDDFSQRKADEVKWAHALQETQERRKREEEEEARRKAEHAGKKAKEEEEDRQRRAMLRKRDEEEEEARKKREHEEKRGNSAMIAGGFTKGQLVIAASPVVVRGQVLVAKGTRGSVVGPALTNPAERVHVVFKNAKKVSINVVPQEIRPAQAEDD